MKNYLSSGWVATVLFCVSPLIFQPAMALPRPQSPPLSQLTDISQMRLIYVSTSGNDQNDGSRQAPLKTITQALRIATPNTAILLAPGTYSAATGEIFPLQLKPQVVLQGNPNSQGKEVIIYGGGEFISATNGTQNIAVKSADGATLTGVTITNPNNQGYGFWVESSVMTVSHNTFTGNARDGISVVGMSTPVIVGNIFINNGVNGMTIDGYSQPQVRDNHFQSTGLGINIAQNAAPRLMGNWIIENQDGIVMAGNARPILRNNYIEDNQRDGIVVMSGAFPNLGTASEPGGNTIRDNGRYDIHNAVKSQPIPAAGNVVPAVNNMGEIDWAGVISPPSPPIISGPPQRAASTRTTVSSDQQPTTLSINSVVYTPQLNRQRSVIPVVSLPRGEISPALAPGSEILPILVGSAQELSSVPPAPPVSQESQGISEAVVLEIPRVEEISDEISASLSTPINNSLPLNLPPVFPEGYESDALILEPVLERSEGTDLSSSSGIAIPVPPPESDQAVVNEPLLRLQRQPQTRPANRHRRSRPEVAPAPQQRTPRQNHQRESNPGTSVTTSLLPVPGPNIPVGSGGYIPPTIQVTNPIRRESSSRSSQTQVSNLGLQYRVIVHPANDGEAAQVRSLIPQAFSTILEGQEVMQVGAFRSRQNAEEIWQLLIRNGLDARIELIQ